MSDTPKTLTAFASDDLIALYKTMDADPRKVLMSVFLAFLEANITFPNRNFHRQEVTSGHVAAYSVSVANNGKSVLLFVNHAGVSNTTIVLPATPVDGQEIWIKFSANILVPTFNGNGHSLFWSTYTTIADSGYESWNIIKYAEVLDMWYPVTEYDPT